MTLDIDTFLKSGALISFGDGKLLAGWDTTWQEHPSKEGPSLYFPDFFLKAEKPWLIPSQWCEISIEELLHKLPQITEPQTYKWHNPYHSHFQNAFVDLKQAFRDNILQKAVPYVFELSPSVLDWEKLTQSLQRVLSSAKSQPVHIYGFWDKHSGMLGATPELLFSYHPEESRILHTHACAGTIGDGETFSLSAKELEEHNLVIEGIKEALSEFGQVDVGQRQELHLPHLKHLITPIEMKLSKPFDFDAIVRALHPTPALGAFPKQPGISWLHDYQLNVHRNRYGAPVGCLYKSQSLCYVAIRNMQWDSNGIKIGAGCGIVAGSQFESEWREINLKLRAIKDQLAL